MFTHHAYLYRGAGASAVGIDIVKWRSLHEVHYYNSPSLPIDTVREIISLASHTPDNQVYKVFVLDVDTILVEAQNALLKILENPPLSTVFVLVVRSHTKLLPTVLSRCVAMDNVAEEKVINIEFLSFITLSIAERLSRIDKASKQKETTWFKECEEGLFSWLEAGQAVSPKVEILEDIIWLKQRGGSRKMVWEDLAFRLPLVSK